MVEFKSMLLAAAHLMNPRLGFAKRFDQRQVGKSYILLLIPPLQYFIFDS